MGMAHAVEGRFHFWIIVLWNSVAGCRRLQVARLTEKYLLKRLGATPAVRDLAANKTALRAPIIDATHLDPRKIAATGLFRAKAVAQLVHKIESGVVVSESTIWRWLASFDAACSINYRRKFQMPPPFAQQRRRESLS